MVGCAGVTIDTQGIRFNQRKTNPVPIVNPTDPVTTKELWLMVLHDPSTDTKLPATQLDLMTSKNLRDFAKTYCVKDSDGNPEYRYVDGTSDGLSKLSGQWKTMADANPPKSLPWLIAVNGKSTLSMAVPTDWTDDFKSQMDRIAGIKKGQ